LLDLPLTGLAVRLILGFEEGFEDGVLLGIMEGLKEGIPLGPAVGASDFALLDLPAAVTGATVPKRIASAMAAVIFMLKFLVLDL